jgi:MarR family transcriptional regulator for hemolysin
MPVSPDLPDTSADVSLFDDDGDRIDQPAKVVSSVFRAAQLLRSLLASDFSRHGISGARFAALGIIGRSAPAGCSQAELAARLEQSESSVSGLVSRMRDDGLLYRLRPKQDRRKRVLLLSQRGRQLLACCEESHRRQMTNALDRFDIDPLRQLSELLDHLVDGLSHAQATVDSRNTAADRSNADESSRLSA